MPSVYACRRGRRRVRSGAPDRMNTGHDEPQSPERREATRWRDLVARLGAEIAAPLTAALDRVHALASTGRIDRQNLRSLREELEQARQVGMVGQQLARFGSGRLRQAHERIHLTQTLKSVLKHRARDIQSLGLQIAELLRPVEVIADGSLLFVLLTSLLDWAMSNARDQIEFRIDVRHWPSQAQLTCRFVDARPLDDAVPAEPAASGLDSLTWQLVQQTAWTMGLTIERSQSDGQTIVELEFPRTVSDEVEGVSATELHPDFGHAPNAKPLAGHQVLVVASRRDIRAQVLEALRNSGLIIDFVQSMAEAAQFCHEGLPHAIVYESALAGDQFSRLRDEVLAAAPEMAFVEIVEEGASFQISGFSGEQWTRVGREAILTSLSSALMFELSKGV
jgi:hypothetical protein